MQAFPAASRILGVERNLDPVIQPTRDRTETYDNLQLSYAQAKEVTGFQQDADVLVVNVQPGEAVCNAGDDPSIDAALNVYPCPGLRMPLGNLKQQRLDAVLLHNSGLEKVASLSLDDLEICQTCPVRDGCYRCHGHAFQDVGDYTKCAKMDRRQATIRRELMIEGVAEFHDHLLEKFVEGEEGTVEEIMAAIRHGTVEQIGRAHV